jgi:flagellar hook-length control protein FliK
MSVVAAGVTLSQSVAADQTGGDPTSPNDAAIKPTADSPLTAELAVHNSTRRSAGGAAQHSRRVGDAHEGPPVDPARFVGRVARAFQFAQERGGTLQLRLSPPELGSLKLELTVEKGVLHANLETESAAAKRLLLENLPALRDRLAEQNVRVERFDVDVRREDQNSQRNAYQQGQQDQPQRDGHRYATAHARSKLAGSEVTRPQQRAAITVSTNSEINLVV